MTMVANNSRGMYIVIEGMDGAGTTTQSRLLVDELNDQDRPTIWIKEPGGSYETLIRDILGRGIPLEIDALPLLFARDRLDILKTKIDPTLAAGVNVVSDRSFISSCIYQHTSTFERVGPEEVLAINDQMRRPDKLFVLQPTLEECKRRLGTRKSRDSMETDWMLAANHECYACFINDNLHPDISRAFPDKIVIHDIGQGIAAIQATIQENL